MFCFGDMQHLQAIRPIYVQCALELIEESGYRREMLLELEEPSLLHFPARLSFITTRLIKLQ